MSSNAQKGKTSAADSTADGTTRAISSRSEIASSASSLFQSLLRPAASEASRTVQTAQQSKGQSSTPTGGESSQYYWEDASSASRPYAQPFRHLPGGQNAMEFRSTSITSMKSINGDFQRFSTELSQTNSATLYSEMTEPFQNSPLQEDIIQLLSSSTLTEAIWEPVPPSCIEENASEEVLRPGLHAWLTEFIAVEDIVEFLSREGTIYTEEVWGNMLGLLQEAQKEVAESKGKGKGPSHGNAVGRLKMIQGQLRSKL